MVIIAVGVGLSYRLAFWSIVDRASLVSAAAAERSGSGFVLPSRGLILDDRGNPLAVNDQVYSVYGSPIQVARPEPEARMLAPLLKQPASSIAKLLESSAVYPRLSPAVPQSTADIIQRLADGGALPGISLQPIANRVYPEASLASQVLGFVNSNGGQYGVEQYYNGLLSGQDSLSSFLANRGESHDVVRADGNLQDQGSQNGATLHLSLDTYMQNIVEDDLKKAVVASGGSSGTAIITVPHTGRIIAMASYPSFDPNQPNASPVANWTNPAVSDTYEPGSTFKIFTMAAGLSDHVITPYTTIFDPGYAVYPSITVHNWDYPTPNGQENMIQVLQHSANVGAAFVANRLGVSRFYPFIRRFGVGSLTGVDLAGESPGFLPLPGTRVWSQSNLYTNAYGQAETLTPLQLITGVNAVANGGLLMRPEMVSRIDYRGKVVYRRPAVIRRVISRATAHTLTSMLVKSAINGEASCALVSGYQVAAKTGTANIAGPNGAYLSGPGSTIASTVAYAPAFHPRFSVLVIVRKPMTWPWGSLIAAPVVHYLFEALFLHYHIQPTLAAPPPVQCPLKLAS
ncbi:MAG TPA: penicillin-binding protein 2 [Chloroflexota bacterium]|nr:penicillin-binding protein 2 [Chloroflexota bacterium]